MWIGREVHQRTISRCSFVVKYFVAGIINVSAGAGKISPLMYLTNQGISQIR